MSRTPIMAANAEPPRLTEERKKALRQAKLSAALLKMLEHPPAGNRTIEVQIWLNDSPASALESVKGHVGKITATLIPKKLILAELDLTTLDALLELPGVRRVDLPRFK